MEIVDIHYSWYLVAYLDVLGQRDLLAALENTEADMANPDFKKRLRYVHMNSVYFLEKSREQLVSLFKSMEANPPEIYASDEKQKALLELSRTEVSTSFFSDSMIFSVCLETEKYHARAVNGVYNALVACGARFLFSLALKKALRCGIDVGLGTRMKSGEVYGLALSRAVCLERNVANYPRIVIGNEFYNYLQNIVSGAMQGENQNEIDRKYCQQMGKRCLLLIEKDYDDNYILDYLGGQFRSALPQNEDTVRIIKEAKKFIDEGCSFWEKEGKKEIAKKYGLLNEYFLRKVIK